MTRTSRARAPWASGRRRTASPSSTTSATDPRRRNEFAACEPAPCRQGAARLWRRLREPAAAALPPRARLLGVAGGNHRHGHAPWIGASHAGGGLAGLSIRSEERRV